MNLLSTGGQKMRYGMKVVSVLIGIALVLAGARAALAQSGAGSIEGTVSDSTGAVIPGAVVHVVNVATGAATDTKSNGLGFYQVPGLFTGTYKITLTSPGMKAFATSIELLVAQSAVINPTLSPGSETEAVTVRADAVQLTVQERASCTCGVPSSSGESHLW
jgi:hypothetical protein